MNILRTALFTLLLNVPILAQPAPTASDASVVTADATASVYLTVNNPTMYDIYVMSATSDAAGKVELLSGDKPVESLTVAVVRVADVEIGRDVLAPLGFEARVEGGRRSP